MVTDSTALVAIERLLDLGRHVLRLTAGVAALFFLASLAHRWAAVADRGRGIPVLAVHAEVY